MKGSSSGRVRVGESLLFFWWGVKSLLFLMVGWGNRYSFLWWGGGITTLPYGGVGITTLPYGGVGITTLPYGGVGITTLPYGGVGESLLFLMVGWGWGITTFPYGPGGGITTLPYGGVMVAGKVIAHCKIPLHKKISCRGKALCGDDLGTAVINTSRRSSVCCFCI